MFWSQEVAEAIMAEHQRGVVYQNTDHVMLIAEYCQLCEKFVVPENTDVVARHMMKEGKIVQSTLQGGVQVRWHISQWCQCSQWC